MENFKSVDVEKSTPSSIITINVGGVKFETRMETLQKIPNSKLAILLKEPEYFLNERGEYFFDRDPHIFAAVLNYHRIGELHLPQDFCSMTVRHELIFWNIDEDTLEQCCWMRYQEQIEKQKILEKLDQAAISIHTPSETCNKAQECCHCWQIWRPRIWSFLDNPQSSKWAKVFACVSAMVIILSLFTLCAETHPDFRQNLTAENYAEIHGVSVDDLYESWKYHGLYEYEDADYDSDSTNKDYNPTEITSTDFPPMNSPPPEKYDQDETLSVPVPFMDDIDLACHIYFVTELLVRFVFCPSKRYFFVNVFNIIDLISTLPFFIDMVINYISTTEKYKESTLDIIQMLRVIRVTRIFRLVRHYRGLQILTFTLWASIREVLLMLVFLTIGMVVFSCLVYYANMGNFKSIPDAFWWAIVTMTTVGYGDKVPNSRWGYFVGALCTISGVLVIAFTVPVIVSNFMLFYQYVELSAKKKEQSMKKQAERMQTRRTVVCPTMPVEINSKQDVRLDGTEKY